MLRLKCICRLQPSRWLLLDFLKINLLGHGWWEQQPCISYFYGIRATQCIWQKSIGSVSVEFHEYLILPRWQYIYEEWEGRVLWDVRRVSSLYMKPIRHDYLVFILDNCAIKLYIETGLTESLSKYHNGKSIWVPLEVKKKVSNRTILLITLELHFSILQHLCIVRSYKYAILLSCGLPIRLCVALTISFL